MVTQTREERGRLIAEKPNQIMRLDERFYRVASQTRDIMYDVTKRLNGGWLCTCPDFQNRNVVCKHIWAVQVSLAVRREVEARVIEPVTFDACIYCHSPSLMKWGVRHNKYGDIQKFACNSCGKYFTVNLGFEKMKHDPKAITTAMQLYFSDCEEKISPRSREIDDKGELIPEEIIKEMVELGIFGVTIPEQYGGSASLGEEMTYATLAVHEIARAELSMALPVYTLLNLGWSYTMASKFFTEKSDRTSATGK